jgi:hypothetical protein
MAMGLAWPPCRGHYGTCTSIIELLPLFSKKDILSRIGALSRIVQLIYSVEDGFCVKELLGLLVGLQGKRKTPELPLVPCVF